jgi:hypothetical protein
LTLRYGHIWREKANAKHGVIVSADEQHPPKESRTKDVEAAHSTREVEEHEKNHDDGDIPSNLVSVPPLRTGKAVKDGNAVRPDISRQSTRNDMPGVQEVLKRTVSLSGASVH